MHESTYFYLLLVVVFVLAGVVKGVTGMGLPTVAMGLGSTLSPVAAASCCSFQPSSPMRGNCCPGRRWATSCGVCGR
jgi:hypothetical protein